MKLKNSFAFETRKAICMFHTLSRGASPLT